MKWGAVAAALAAAAFARDVGASIAVSLPPPPTKVVAPPLLIRESALIIWDGQREHLILDLSFAHSEPKFAFLIPVPNVPEVAALEKSPFALLSAELPFEKDRKTLMFTGQAWKTAAKPGTAIEIYSEQRIGTFIATVIPATDEALLSKWLADQGLDTVASFASFRARYATLRFQLVALRYEPASPPEPGMTSQTLRLSFDTKAPFFPYFEPPRADGVDRRLSMWVVTRSEQLVPVAARDAGFVRPLLEGGRYRVGRFVVERAIGELSSLLPTGAELNVQAFEDRKLSRQGFSDVVWVPEVEVTGDRREVATWLDPRLSETPVSPPLAPPAPAPTTPVQITTSRCAASPGASASFAPWMAVAIALGVRRRWLAALITLGCRKEPLPAPPPAPVSSASVVPPFASAERMREVDAIVRGAVPPGGLPVIAHENGAPWDPPRKAPSIKLDAVAEGSITRESVLRTARVSASRFRACYDLGLRTLPTLSGRVTAFITINTTGQTEKAKVTDNLPHAATVACLTAVFQSLTFAQANPPAPSSATIELELSSAP